MLNHLQYMAIGPPLQTQTLSLSLSLSHTHARTYICIFDSHTVMQPADTPSALLWVKVTVKHRFHKFTRWLRRDKTRVYCIEDLIQPPPQYQTVRRNPPCVGELQMLQGELYRYRRQLFSDNTIYREFLSADVESLNRWIEQLEDLVYYEAATTIPERYRHEPIKSRILRRIRKRRGDIPPTHDEALPGETSITEIY